jgi:hypothetical protein
MQMPDIVEYTMANVQHHPSPDLEFLETSDKKAREKAINYINKHYKKR